MAKKINTSQFKSQMRQAQHKAERQIRQEQRKAEQKMKAELNRATRIIERDVNREIRKYNAQNRRNQQIIERELKKLNTYSTVQNTYFVSLEEMQKCYSTVENMYYEYDVTPEQEKILDLLAQEHANSLITANSIDNNLSPDFDTEDAEIGLKLAQVSSDLSSRWEGAVFALNPNNPDATRHFCTSTREIFSEFLEIKAPDKAVFDYNPSCEKTERGNATRREKIKYMMRNLNMDDSVVSFAEADINNILELNRLLSGGTHGPAGKFSFKQLLRVKKRVEQGINFLCEISL